MRIRELILTNIKLLADQTISFERGSDVRTWTALLGDNGLCKTTVLQAIALATSGEKLARLLIDDAQEFVRADRLEQEARIEARLDTDDGELDVALWVEPGSHAFVGNHAARALDRFRDRRVPGFFVAGYGVGRRLPRRGEVAISRDPMADRVRGLFDAHHKMLGSDFFEALKDLDGSPGAAERLGLDYARRLRELLLVDDGVGNALLPALNSVELRGQGGVSSMEKLLESRRLEYAVDDTTSLKLAPHQLSQGYQSMFAWLADLLGNAFVDAGQDVDPAELRGIVLLDEIDLHLHPTWQRRTVPALRRAFPKLQFVVTTHSPLLLTGLEADEVVGFQLRDGEVHHRTFDTEPALKTSMELMEDFFDVEAAGRPELLQQRRELVNLAADPSSDPADVERLQNALKRYTRSTAFAGTPSLTEILKGSP